MAIARELNGRRIKVVAISASDPLDEIFLARFFRRTSPDARLVFVESDLLMARDGDVLPYVGSITVSPYSFMTKLFRNPGNGGSRVYTVTPRVKRTTTPQASPSGGKEARRTPRAHRQPRPHRRRLSPWKATALMIAKTTCARPLSGPPHSEATVIIHSGWLTRVRMTLNRMIRHSTAYFRRSASMTGNDQLLRINLVISDRRMPTFDSRSPAAQYRLCICDSMGGPMRHCCGLLSSPWDIDLLRPIWFVCHPRSERAEQ